MAQPLPRRSARRSRPTAGASLLWLRPLDAIAAQPLTGTESAGAFQSLYSRFLRFFTVGYFSAASNLPDRNPVKASLTVLLVAVMKGMHKRWANRLKSGETPDRARPISFEIDV